jgi:uncharacterized protein (TIGR02646 family)
MRPVKRGECPLNDDDTEKTFANYESARKDLIDRMGQYCSYCNQKLPASLAVEHVRPKAVEPALELQWDNFLLGCTNCNSTKGKKPVKLEDYLWPDIHNTHLAFEYKADGKVEVKGNLTAGLATKAQNTLDLVGLQKYPDTATASDRRWLNRKAAFETAQTCLKLYNSASAKGAANESEGLLAFLASENGFFSIWMNVFDAYPSAKQKIVEAFKGTAADSLNADYTFKKRTVDL